MSRYIGRILALGGTCKILSTWRFCGVFRTSRREPSGLNVHYIRNLRRSELYRLTESARNEPLASARWSGRATE
eukprot:57979-Amorphochlora_amoeboformis.AAC.2